MAKHDIHGRRLQIEQISHADQSDDDLRILVQRILRYDASLASKVLTGLDLVYADWVFAVMEGVSQSIALIESSSSVSIDWQNDIAPDEDGDPGTITFYESFGDTPTIQVWLETSANNYSLEVVPVTMTFSAGSITTVNIDTSNIPARIIIK